MGKPITQEDLDMISKIKFTKNSLIISFSTLVIFYYFFISNFISIPK